MGLPQHVSAIRRATVHRSGRGRPADGPDRRPAAWRAGGDTHACPLVNGVQPHVGGVVSVGSATVRIGGLPAARQGDVITEAGGPNTIAVGAPTVTIG